MLYVYLQLLETHQWKNSYRTAVNSILHLFLEMLFRKNAVVWQTTVLRNLQKFMLQEMWNHFIHKISTIHSYNSLRCSSRTYQLANTNLSGSSMQIEQKHEDNIQSLPHQSYISVDCLSPDPVDLKLLWLMTMSCVWRHSKYSIRHCAGNENMSSWNAYRLWIWANVKTEDTQV